MGENEGRSEYRLGMRALRDVSSCRRLAYLRAHRQRRPREGDESIAKLRRLYGDLVRNEARKEFSSGVLIEERSFRKACTATREAIKSGARTIFEGRFSHNRVGIRTDVLTRGRSGQWSLWLVRSGMSADRYVEDAAIQKHVLLGAGLPVRTGIMVLDRDATFTSETVFRRTDCNDASEELLPQIRRRVTDLRRLAASPEPPDEPLRRACGRCDYCSTCWPDLPEPSVFRLYQGGGGWRSVDDLIERGNLSLDEVPRDIDLGPIQRTQLEALRTGRPVVSGSPSRALKAITRRPLFFLDFEATAPPVPSFPDQRPYDMIPFQWSCHVRRSDSAPLDHHEFLWEHGGDPRRALTEELLELLGDRGSIIVYSDYEGRVLRRLGEIYPDLTGRLLDVEARIVDLLKIVERHYYHPEFGGSFSIKNVLPVVAPGLDYSDLSISDGTGAVAAYHEFESPGVTEERRREISRDLREYCRRDTQAMVEVYQYLCGAG